MFEVAVDGFGGVNGRVGVVEVGQDVPGSAFERPAQMSSVRQLGTRVEVSVLISACIRALPALVAGAL